LGRGGREIWGRQGGRDLGEGEGEGGGARTGFWICDLRVKKTKKSLCRVPGHGAPGKEI